MRVALIGLGEAGAGIHLGALRGLERVELVAAVDPVAERRTAVGAEWRCATFSDVAPMLASTSPDVVIVASPPAFHAAHCIAALDAGAHVVCEKPFAATAAEAARIVAHAQEMSRFVAVNHEFRALPIFRDVIAGARSEGVAVAQLWQAIQHDPAGERGWRGQLRRRSLYEAGAHLIDIALNLFQTPPARVRASFDSDGDRADATALVTIEFADGRLAQLTQSRLHRGDRQYLEVRADTPRASWRASFGGRLRITAGLLRSTRPHLEFERGASGIAWREEGASRRVISRNGGAPLVSGTRDVLSASLTAFRSGSAGPYDGAAAVTSLRVTAAAYLSAELGRAISLGGADGSLCETLALAEVRR